MKTLINSFETLFFLFTYCFCSSFSAYGQDAMGKEYFVRVNPETGEFEQKTFVPGVRWIGIGLIGSAYSSYEGYYFFRGANDTLREETYYTIESASGRIKYSVPLPAFKENLSNVLGLCYDNKRKCIYGIHWDESVRKEYFIKFDYTSGQMHIINNLPGVFWVRQATYDEDSSRYFLWVADSLRENQFLLTIDAATGKVLYSPHFLEGNSWPRLGASNFNYDERTKKLYCFYLIMHNDGTKDSGFFASVNTYSGNVDIIKQLPDTVNPNFSTLDKNHGYCYMDVFIKGTIYLYKVDIRTGDILSIMTVIQHYYSGENLVCIRYDNQTDRLYGLHWNLEPSATELQVFPNPSADYVYVYSTKHFKYLSVYDVKGQKLYEASPHKLTNNMVVNVSDYPAGVYALNAVLDNGEIKKFKVIVQH